MYLHHIELQLLEFGLLLIAAYVGGKITAKLNMGEIVGQILGGMLVSPYSLELMYTLFLRICGTASGNDGMQTYHFRMTQFPEYARILEGHMFFVFLLLGIIAFSIGEELHKDRLRHIKMDSVLISVLQSTLTFLLLVLGFWGVFRFPLIQAMLIGSIGVASAPVLTFALVTRWKIEGTLREMLANITVVADLLEILSFATLLAVAVVLQREDTLSMQHLFTEIATELFWAAGLGFGIFVVLKISVKKSFPPEENSEEERTFLAMIFSDHPTPSVEILVMIMGTLALGIGLGIHFRLPFLISAVLAGTLIANWHSPDIFNSLRLENITPLFNLFFFALIGSMIRLESFSRETVLYIAGFLLLRAAGKMLGTWGGCRLTGQDPKMTACLPKLVLPQAGMAAVETILAATVLRASDGMLLFNTIIPALISFELLGAWLSERTLRKWREWTVGERDAFREPGSGGHDVSLSALVGDRVVEIAAATKGAAISELARYCMRAGMVDDMDSLRELIEEREQLGSTGIGDGIALPHCRTGCVEQPQIVCGLMQKPVPWGAPDLQPVEVAFLFVTPEHSPEQHLHAIRTISLALQQKDFKQKIRQAFYRNDLEEYLKRVSSLLHST